MPKTTKIHVDKCDNELIMMAVPVSGPGAGLGSFELLHITSGFNNPVSYEVVPQSVLPAGDYTLVAVGVNWGGPSQFHATLTGPGTQINFTVAGVGAQSQSVPMTV